MSGYENEANWLTSEEAKLSIEQGTTRSEMKKCFQITKDQLENLLSGKVKRIKIPKTSMWYEEPEGITELKSAIKDFVNIETSLGGSKKSTELALKNILRDTLKEIFTKVKIQNESNRQTNRR